MDIRGLPYNEVHGVPLNNRVLHQGYISREYTPKAISTSSAPLTSPGSPLSLSTPEPPLFYRITVAALRQKQEGWNIRKARENNSCNFSNCHRLASFIAWIMGRLEDRTQIGPRIYVIDAHLCHHNRGWSTNFIVDFWGCQDMAVYGFDASHIAQCCLATSASSFRLKIGQVDRHY